MARMTDTGTTNSSLRDWTYTELNDRFGENHKIVCPACETTRFSPGPRGPGSRNYECENGHRWDVSAFGMMFIGLRPGPDCSCEQMPVHIPTCNGHERQEASDAT